MKKIILGIIAAFALTAFVAPAKAEEPAAGGDAAKADKKEKKGKKGKKADKAEGGDAAGAPAGGDKK
jgi:hypothetical protein